MITHPPRPLPPQPLLCDNGPHAFAGLRTWAHFQIMIQDRELLTPSLTADARVPRAIYSARTGFLASFLGGPVAAGVVALVNAQRLRRLRTDWPVGLLALALCVLMRLSVMDHFWDWLDNLLGKGSARFVYQLMGMTFFGAIYALHRPYYRSMSLLGLKTPNGIVLGIVAIALGVGVQIGLFYLIPS